MGYDVHITRREDWSAVAGPAISEQELQSLLPEYPQLRDIVFWSEGNAVCKNPTKQEIAKMVTLARRLSARVQGDDGEIYIDDGEIAPDEQADFPQPPQGHAAAWWSFFKPFLLFGAAWFALVWIVLRWFGYFR